MFKPASFFIGLRYTRAKRRNHFISFISFASMFGIALGVMVLITVLSVMNGFDKEIKHRVFSMVPPVTVSSVSGYVSDWEVLDKKLRTLPDVKAVAPYAGGQGLMSYGGSVQPAMLMGIQPDRETKITELGSKITEGKLTNLTAGSFGIVLGDELAMSLGARMGDKVTVVTPQVTLSPAGMMPRYKRFTVVGIFSAGGGFGFDRSLGFIALSDAQKLFGLGAQISGVRLSIHDVFGAPQFAQTLSKELAGTAIINTWADQFGEFFHAIKLEKTMMFLILMLIIAVATFNLVSTLVMVVNDKEADIAILRTFGATPKMVMMIFVVQGGLIGVIGTFVGVLCGVILSLNVTELVNFIEHAFHVQFLSSNVYFVDYLPSDIQFLDVLKITCASLLLSLLATIYPAWRASRLDPVESLRYE